MFLIAAAGGGRLDPTDKRVEELGRLEMSLALLQFYLYFLPFPVILSIFPVFLAILSIVPANLYTFPYFFIVVAAGGGRLDPADKRVEELGRLEMSWKTLLGEPGRLHSVVSLQQVSSAL